MRRTSRRRTEVTSPSFHLTPTSTFAVRIYALAVSSLLCSSFEISDRDFPWGKNSLFFNPHVSTPVHLSRLYLIFPAGSEGLDQGRRVDYVDLLPFPMNISLPSCASPTRSVPIIGWTVLAQQLDRSSHHSNNVRQCV